MRNLSKGSGVNTVSTSLSTSSISNLSLMSFAGISGSRSEIGNPSSSSSRSDSFSPFELSFLSILIAGFIGLIAGVISSTKQYSLFDNLSMVGALFGISMPIFWLGLLLMLVFSVQLRWFPAGGKGTIMHLILPAIALGAASSAVIARMTRASMLEIIRQDYIRTARANGLREFIVTYKHALKNAMIPVITVFGLEFGYMLGGAVLTETVFSLPGVGRLMIEGIFQRDYPVVQGSMLMVATTFVLVNLVTDIAYAFFDPRIRYE